MMLIKVKIIPMPKADLTDTLKPNQGSTIKFAAILTKNPNKTLNRDSNKLWDFFWPSLIGMV